MIADEIIDVIIRNEGGYVNHPKDPGGETKYGISKRAYPNLDIKNLTSAHAFTIYLTDYYHGINAHLIDDEELRLHLVDMSVNAGKGTAVRILQRLAGVKADGALGTITANAVNYKISAGQYKSARIAHYEKIVERRPRMAVFLKGWLNRVNKTRL
jgi:lysozyme family protein